MTTSFPHGMGVASRGSPPALPSATSSHSAANVAHLGPGVRGRGLVVRSRTEGPLRDSSGEPGCDTAPAALVMFAPDTVCADYGGLRGADEARRAWPALPPELRCRQAGAVRHRAELGPHDAGMDLRVIGGLR